MQGYVGVSWAVVELGVRRVQGSGLENFAPLAVSFSTSLLKLGLRTAAGFVGTLNPKP